MGHSKNSHDIQQCLTASGYIKVFPFGGRAGCRDQCEHRDVSSLGDSVSTVVTAAAKREEGGGNVKRQKINLFSLNIYVVGFFWDILGYRFWIVFMRRWIDVAFLEKFDESILIVLLEDEDSENHHVFPTNQGSVQPDKILAGSLNYILCLSSLTAWSMPTCSGPEWPSMDDSMIVISWWFSCSKVNRLN